MSVLKKTLIKTLAVPVCLRMAPAGPALTDSAPVVPALPRPELAVSAPVVPASLRTVPAVLAPADPREEGSGTNGECK